MRDRPTGAELANLVRRVRAGDPGVEVPDDRRYRELMLASAMAIAERQETNGDAPEQDERQALIRILGEERSLEDLNWALAAAIRDGRVTSAEVVDACLARIDEVNPALNAVVQLRADAARDALLTSIGFIVLRYDYRRVFNDPGGVIAEIAAVVERGDHLSAGPTRRP